MRLIDAGSTSQMTDRKSLLRCRRRARTESLLGERFHCRMVVKRGAQVKFWGGSSEAGGKVAHLGRPWQDLENLHSRRHRNPRSRALPNRAGFRKSKAISSNSSLYHPARIRRMMDDAER
jgi:hypothetical protein